MNPDLPLAAPTEPQKGEPCVICEKPITGYDSYGVSDQHHHRYHWDCIRREAATVSAPTEDTKRLDWLEQSSLRGMFGDKSSVRQAIDAAIAAAGQEGK